MHLLHSCRTECLFILAKEIVCWKLTTGTVHRLLPVSQGRPGPAEAPEMLQSQSIAQVYASLAGSATQVSSSGWALARKFPLPPVAMGNSCPDLSSPWRYLHSEWPTPYFGFWGIQMRHSASTTKATSLGWPPWFFACDCIMVKSQSYISETLPLINHG